MTAVDIQDLSDVSSDEGSSSSSDSGSEEELIRKAKAQGISTDQNSHRAPGCVSSKKKNKNGGTEIRLKEGEEIVYVNGKKKKKTKDGRILDVESSGEEAPPGKRKKDKKKKKCPGDGQSSDEEIVNGQRVKKKKKNQRADSVSSYEVDEKTGLKKKKVKKGKADVEEEVISMYSYQESEGGTVRRRLKKIRKPGEVYSEDSFEEFDQEKANEERIQRRRMAAANGLVGSMAAASGGIVTKNGPRPNGVGADGE